MMMMEEPQQPYRISNSVFESSVIGYLTELHDSKSFTDVMIYTQGNVTHAHKIVLASGSGYFKDLFETVGSKGPCVVALPSVKTHDLELLIKFLYHGHVDILTEDLECFLTLARELRVVGMETNEEESSSTETQQECYDDEFEESVSVTTESNSELSKPFVCGKCGKTYNSNKSLWRHKKFTCEEKIQFKCKCGKVFSRSDNLRRHVVVAHQSSYS